VIEPLPALLSMLSRHARRILLVLLCAPAAALAHISGFTDTSIQITATGIRILYTLPSDSLLELNAVPGQGDIAPPPAYLAAVRDGWSIRAAGERCLITHARARALDKLPSYQYQLTYACPHGVDGLSIGYGLFFERWADHENFVRVFMAGQRQRMRFTAENRTLSIPVAALLAQWGQPLASGFFDADPNRGLKEALAGGEDALPRVVEPAASLGGISLEQLDPGFITLGLKHIFLGLDHVLFVVGLVLVTHSWRRLLLLVTSFTLAHSVTLGLSTLGLVDFPSRVTEPLIALTILYIGLENLWALRRRKQPRFREDGTGPVLRRAALVFAFGLIHGVGFSYVLREMGLREDLLGSLLYFNVGVEAGQLAIIAATLPLVLLWRRLSWGGALSALASLAVAGTGAVMFINRI
jgi:hydrogenase/urease accessory protein HupE